MGESKRRGSKQERIEQALGLKKQKTDALKKKIGVPEDAEFCGYIIHLKEKDEFIHSIEDTPVAIKRTFVKTPEHAMRFEHFWDAYKYTKKEDGDAVVGLFDLGGQFIIHSVL